MRLIDADAIIYHEDDAVYRHEIDALPSVEPEIIPCKDCKYGEIDDPDFPNEYFCRFKGFDWNDGEHYCSDAKRRTGWMI